MQSIKKFRLATQSITAIMMFGIAYAAGADQMMRALPGAAPVTAAKPVVVAPAGIAKLPDLAFSNMTVDTTTYYLDINSGAKSLVVNNILPSVPSGVNRPARDPCDRTFTFPLQLNVKNIGHAEYVPKSSFESVGVSIGQWGGAKDLVTMPVQGGETMNFSVTLPPGKYTLNAEIVSKNVAESRTDNNKLSWPLEVKCTVNAGVIQAPTQLPEIVADGVGMTIGGQVVAFTNSNPVSIRSTTMMPTAASSSACRFVGSFQLKNTGAGAAPAFDVYTMADSELGVRSMKTGYMIPGMQPGASYPEKFYLDLSPGIYSVILVIDPEKKLQQSTQNPKRYLVKINASCGPAPLGGGVKKKPAPFIPVN